MLESGDVVGGGPLSEAASSSPPAPRVSCVYLILLGSGFAGLGEARGYAAAIAIQHLLRTLEAKGIMEPTETAAMLDGILDKLACLGRDGVMSPEETASARKNYWRVVSADKEGRVPYR